MWVWIRELSFAPEHAAEVIDRVRNTASARHGGDGYQGFRLLVDRSNGKALDVSYWDNEQTARATDAAGLGSCADVPGVVVEKSDHYELAIDAA